jgi:hypothetical protein
MLRFQIYHCFNLSSITSFYFFWWSLGFKLIASFMLGRCCTAWTTLSAANLFFQSLIASFLHEDICLLGSVADFKFRSMGPIREIQDKTTEHSSEERTECSGLPCPFQVWPTHRVVKLLLNPVPFLSCAHVMGPWSWPETHIYELWLCLF